MVGWHHWLNEHEFEQTLGNNEGQGSLECCSPWSHKELDRTYWLNNKTEQQQPFKCINSTNIYWVPVTCQALYLALGYCGESNDTVYCFQASYSPELCWLMQWPPTIGGCWAPERGLVQTEMYCKHEINTRLKQVTPKSVSLMVF